jgi:peptide/nickel transport system substrate-binding protein
MSQGQYYGSGDNQPWLDTPFGLVDWTARATPGPLIQMAFVSGAPWNGLSFSNKEYDKLLDDFGKEVDEGARQEIASKMSTIQMDETPAVIAYWLASPRVMKKSVWGVAESPETSTLDISRAYLS